MKIFDATEKKFWGEKVNFLDRNNVLLGYNMDQDCCENADWYLANEPDAKSGHQLREGLDDYVFDVEYFKDTSDTANQDDYGLDDGGAVEFKLTADGEPDLYLTIFNSHNGYYGHGFKWTKDDVVIKENYL